MEIEITLKGETKKIAVQEPLTKHQNEYIDILLGMEKKPEKIKELIKYRDELITELTGIKKEDLENLPVSEKNKILDEIEKRMALFRGNNFLLNSATSQNSNQR